MLRTGSLVLGPFLYYVRVKGWVGGIDKYLLFLKGVHRWVVLDPPYVRKEEMVILT